MTSALSRESLIGLLDDGGVDLVVLGENGGDPAGSPSILTDQVVAEHQATAFLVIGASELPERLDGRFNLRCLPEPGSDDELLVRVLAQLLNEIRLWQHSTLFKACVEASANGIVIVDARADDMPIVHVNQAFSRITGYEPEEVHGCNCRFLQGSDRKQPGVDQVRMAIRAGKPALVQMRNYRRDGSRFSNELQVSPVRENGGQITHYIGVINDVSARMDAESALAYRTSYDGLTGLPNFEQFRSRVGQACEESGHHRHAVALTLFNIDNFKAINATFGAGAADQLLKAVVDRVTPLLGRSDLLARLSADEFAILQTDVLGSHDVSSLVDSVVSVLAIPFRLEGQELFVTASAGIAWTGENVEGADELMSHASLALRNSKQCGGGGYRWYSILLAEEVEWTLKLHNQLQHALSEQQFELYYQPVVEVRSQEIVGIEALLRWHHPEQGMLSPADFLQAIETGGLMVEVTDWVLRQACTDLNRLMEETGRILWVSVNISPNHFVRGDVVSSVKSVLESTGLEPACLNLELVESTFLSFDEPVRRALDEIRTLGVGLMIDDFGAGFSSLNYLKKVPASRIKIDRSFIRDVVSDSADAAITRGVIALAHKLNLQVVGEGVEDRYQLAFLLRNHCDLVQGFLPGPPMPFEQLRTHELSAETRAAFAEVHGRESGNQASRRLLILDDEPNILKSLKRLLRRDGYEIHTVTSAQEALNLLALYEFQVVLSDQRMPEMTGTDFLSRVKELYPDTIRIVLSGYTDLDSVTDAVNRGAIYKFLTKPWDDEQLRSQIRQAFLHHAAVLEDTES
ncbi:EAL domain-containing protein [Halovibrio salipaludis]|nr:EAL domain-containing protein [Halovibrio salipaludis]